MVNILPGHVIFECEKPSMLVISIRIQVHVSALDGTAPESMELDIRNDNVWAYTRFISRKQPSACQTPMSPSMSLLVPWDICLPIPTNWCNMVSALEYILSWLYPLLITPEYNRHTLHGPYQAFFASYAYVSTQR